MPKKYTEIPDFLKSKCTSIRNNEEYKDQEQIQVQEPKINNNVKIKKSIKNESNINSEFLSGLNDFNEDLMSINNFDKKITNDDIEEDNTPFSERLNRLKNDRDNISIQRSAKIDFTSENFEDTYDDIEPTTIKDLIKKKSLNQDIHDKNDNNDNNDNNNNYNQNTNNYNQNTNNYNYNQNTNDNDNDNDKNETISELEVHIKKLYSNYLNLQKKYNSLLEENNILKKKSKKMSRNDKDEYIKIFNDLKKINTKLFEELKNYKNQVNILNDQVNILNEMNNKPKELIDLEKVKNEISVEFKNLSKIKDENESMIDTIQKEKDEYKIIIDEFNKIHNIKFYQMEICNENFSSYYTYNFEKIDNIASIKLLSYSIPSIEFNINEDKNNIFEFEFEPNIVLEIKLDSGKYTIDDLIIALNKNDHELIFKLDIITQKVIISSEKEFKICPTPLSISNLSFINNNYENLKEYQAEKIFDLRLDNKILLYLNNIDNQIPFAILYPGESSSNTILNFENSISLEKLDILFKDSKGRLHNFYNCEHNISLELQVKNV